MLVLARRHGEEIVIETTDGTIVVTVTAIEGGRVKLGFNAPDAVSINRREIWDQIQHEQELERSNDTDARSDTDTDPRRLADRASPVDRLL